MVGDHKLAYKLKRSLQRELYRKLLTDYFTKRGYESPDSPLYPPTVADLPSTVKELYNKLEVVPYSERVDPVTGLVTLGWNLFVLGTNRMFLGTTTHASMSDLRMAMEGAINRNLSSEMITTPGKLVDFVLSVLDDSKAGYSELPPGFELPLQLSSSLGIRGRTPRASPSQSSGFYSKRR